MNFISYLFSCLISALLAVTTNPKDQWVGTGVFLSIIFVYVIAYVILYCRGKRKNGGVDWLKKLIYMDLSLLVTAAVIALFIVIAIIVEAILA